MGMFDPEERAQDYQAVSGLASSDIEDQVTAYTLAAETAKKAEAEKKSWGASIRALLERYWSEQIKQHQEEKRPATLQVGAALVTYIAGRETRELDPQTLLQEGVPAEVLEKAYVTIRSKPYIKVTVPDRG